MTPSRRHGRATGRTVPAPPWRTCPSDRCARRSERRVGTSRRQGRLTSGHISPPGHRAPPTERHGEAFGQHAQPVDVWTGPSGRIRCPASRRVAEVERRVDATRGTDRPNWCRAGPYAYRADGRRRRVLPTARPVWRFYPSEQPNSRLAQEGKPNCRDLVKTDFRFSCGAEPAASVMLVISQYGSFGVLRKPEINSPPV
jgi:hypothetical protein